jgi:hypothetical protein
VVEYQKGNEVQVSQMALDSALGTASRTVSIRRKRPDLDRIIRDARRKVYGNDAMPRAGVPPITDDDDDDDDNTDAEEIVGKLLDFLTDKLSPDDLEGVKSILTSGDGPDSDAGEQQATDRRAARLAVDAQRRQMAEDRGRPLSERAEREALEMFPHWNRLQG